MLTPLSLSLSTTVGSDLLLLHCWDAGGAGRPVDEIAGSAISVGGSDAPICDLADDAMEHWLQPLVPLCVARTRRSSTPCAEPVEEAQAYRTTCCSARALPHQAFGRMEGVLERAWNHFPLDTCLELVDDSTERSNRGVTERCARGLVLRLTECTKNATPFERVEIDNVARTHVPLRFAPGGPRSHHNFTEPQQGDSRMHAADLQDATRDAKHQQRSRQRLHLDYLTGCPIITKFAQEPSRELAVRMRAAECSKKYGLVKRRDVPVTSHDPAAPHSVNHTQHRKDH